MDLASFVLGQLPPRPVRVLEVGCGQGELAWALHASGHDVLAIDPLAPEGSIFRRARLEELDDLDPFAAAVAARSLHHVDDLPAALDRIATLLEPSGLLILDEFGWDLVDRGTAEWYGRGKPVEDVLSDWDAEHDGLHGYEQMRREVDRRFGERFLSWEPYLYLLLKGPAAEAEERELIERGEIRAVGFRYVGRRR